jgi:mono/diheme cytochrome c family protein
MARFAARVYRCDQPMTPGRFSFRTAGASIGAGLALWAAALLPRAVMAETPGYYDQIKPLLAIHCYRCHDAEARKNGLRLDTPGAALAGGHSGKPAIVPGSAGHSEVIRRITSMDPDEQMPPKGARLSTEQVTLIREWIDGGAKWPDRDDYWAFQPPGDPRVPAPAGTASPQHPIDGFIDAKLQASHIEPLPRADARTLLRRAFFDLIGVPPSPGEADAFLDDRSPGAFDRLLDRLLADPRHGERWARHWLDLVRYGESDGYEDDKVRPHAWRYRDYVIRSLNADKPYDRFVQEQIAGDELWPDEPDAWIATGFARLGAWDGMSKDPAQQRQDFLNDATDAVGAVFLGVTLGCARCHDHKFDPVTQRDYYRLQAFFAGVKRESREWNVGIDEPDFVTAAYRTDKAAFDKLKTAKDALLGRAREALQKENAPKLDEAAISKKAETLEKGKLAELDRELKAAEKRMRFSAPAADAVFAGGSAAPGVHVLKGGELRRPGEKVAAGFIGAMLPADTEAIAPHSTRTQLARWLTSPQHPLTARVLVNRLWQHHFGAGLVATPSDFGRNGKSPTHPELLDWLAQQFVRDGWSLKKMHRLMMTSAAYCRSSAGVPPAVGDAVPSASLSPGAGTPLPDPENKLLWRMNRRRLEGEAIRDSILFVSGLLQPSMGGPGVYAPLPKGVNVEFPNNDKELSWGTASESDGRRRSVYLFQRRSLAYPLMEIFDGPPMNQSSAARAQTVVAPQALALFNGEFAREAARFFAARLQNDAGDDLPQQIERAFGLAFARKPSEFERHSARRFLGAQSAIRSGAADAALVDFCHVLLNASEFIHID